MTLSHWTSLFSFTDLKIVISLLSLKKYRTLLHTRGVRYNRVFMLLLSVRNNNQSNRYGRVDQTFHGTAHKLDVVSPYAVFRILFCLTQMSFSCLMLRSALLPYCFPNRSETRNYLVFGEPSIALLWNTFVCFPFPNVDLGITVVSVLQNSRGSTLGRERAH